MAVLWLHLCKLKVGLILAVVPVIACEFGELYELTLFQTVTLEIMEFSYESATGFSHSKALHAQQSVPLYSIYLL